MQIARDEEINVAYKVTNGSHSSGHRKGETMSTQNILALIAQLLEYFFCNFGCSQKVATTLAQVEELPHFSISAQRLIYVLLYLGETYLLCQFVKECNKRCYEIPSFKQCVQIW